MKRRNQLMRENAAKFKDKDKVSAIRRAYLNTRTHILEDKYGPLDHQSMRSKTSSKAPSIDSTSINLDYRDHYGAAQKQYQQQQQRTYTSFGAYNSALQSNPRRSSIYSSKESVNSMNAAAAAAASAAMVSSSVAAPPSSSSSLSKLKTDAALSSALSFTAGIHHVFGNNHKAAVTRIRFANNDKSLLATCSLDGSLVICQVIPSPATVIYKLDGHQSGIMDMQWSQTNDLIVTASLDGTARVWQVSKGAQVRVLKDTCGAQMLCCCFQPLNENNILTGNSKGLVQVYNLSTGILVNKHSVQKTSGSSAACRVECMCFDSSGTNLWIGDDRGFICAFTFDAFTLKLNKTRKIVSNNGYAITSIAYRNCSNSEAHLLVNARPNYLLLYRLTGTNSLSLRLRKTIVIKQQASAIRSTFCPLPSSVAAAASTSGKTRRVSSSSLLSNSSSNSMSGGGGPCLVCSGSEDHGVYLYDMENEERPLVNKLHGHSATVKDVAFNYDQTLLASGDDNGIVIVWKTNDST